MEYYNTIREELIKFFEDHWVDYKASNEYIDLLNQYFNFIIRYIQIKKWPIRVSKELSAKISTHPNKDALFEIFKKLTEGENVNAYQSKNLYKAYYNDYMFNDWVSTTYI